MQKISIVSRVMAIACLLAAGVIATVVTLAWLASPSPFLIDGATTIAITGEITPVKRALGLTLTLIPISLVALTLWRMSSVFRQFARGRIFRDTTVEGLRRAGWAALWATVAKLAVTPLLHVAMTYDNPPGERQLTFSFSSNDLLFLLFAATFLVMAWVMSEARRIAHDLDQFV